MITFIVATRNAHKVREIRTVLGTEVNCFALADLNAAPHLVEDASTFAGNAARKAVQLAHFVAQPNSCPPALAQVLRAERLFSLADDSGLEVDALGGAPGVHSARFAATESGTSGNAPDQANNAKLLTLLSDVPPEKRTARFRCAIAVTPVVAASAQSESDVCYADEAELRTRIFEGACEGQMIDTPRGTHGFGYDPLFVPDGFELTFAELGDDIKNQISHRARALAKLKAALGTL